MSKIETVKDMVREGLVTYGQVRAAAKEIFDGKKHITSDGFEGYHVHVPAFDDLPQTTQDFIIKGMYFAKAQNILEDELTSIREEVESEDVPEDKDASVIHTYNEVLSDDAEDDEPTTGTLHIIQEND